MNSLSGRTQIVPVVPGCVFGLVRGLRGNWRGKVGPTRVSRGVSLFRARPLLIVCRCLHARELSRRKLSRKIA